MITLKIFITIEQISPAIHGELQQNAGKFGKQEMYQKYDKYEKL